MKKKKLELKKKVIASLSDAQKAKIIGGDEAYTTSNSDCTHFICCGDTCSIDPDNCPNDTNDTCTCDTCAIGCTTNACPPSGDC